MREYPQYSALTAYSLNGCYFDDFARLAWTMFSLYEILLKILALSVARKQDGHRDRSDDVGREGRHCNVDLLNSEDVVERKKLYGFAGKTHTVYPAGSCLPHLSYVRRQYVCSSLYSTRYACSLRHLQLPIPQRLAWLANDTFNRCASGHSVFDVVPLCLTTFSAWWQLHLSFQVVLHRSQIRCRDNFP